MVAGWIVAGDFERSEAEVITRLVHPGAAVLELGGGLGFVAATLCKATKVARYTIVEADPDLVPQIGVALARNGAADVDVRWGLVTADPAALAAGTQRFALPENLLANSVFLVDQGNREIDVPAVSLPALLAELNPDVIVADVEGAELGLFDGADLSSVRVLVVELHPQLIGDDGCARVTGAIERQGLQHVVSASGNVHAFQRAM